MVESDGHVCSFSKRSFKSQNQNLIIIFESRRELGLRSASKGDFVVKRANLQFGNRMFEVAGPAE